MEVWATVNVAVDLLEPEAFVLGHITMLDFVLLQILLLAGDDIFQEVYRMLVRREKELTDRDVLVPWEVGLDLGHQ